MRTLSLHDGIENANRKKFYVSRQMVNPWEENQETKLNDRLIRLIGIPFFGISIPNVSGLFGHLSYQSTLYWVGYLYFIALAGLIWQGNRYLLFRTRKRFTWFDKPIEKLILLIINNIFYTAPLTIAWLCLWYSFAGFEGIHWEVIQTVVLINVICVLFVTHVYETVFMLKEQQTEQLKNAELSRAKAEAELSALKNQIDPHFMFNSLNSLSYLIVVDPTNAVRFTENLAEIYRYILMQKDRTLIDLQDELAFTDRYIDLIHLRFGDAVKFRRSPVKTETQLLIPPTSLLVLLENAVKHNEISASQPLQVDIAIGDTSVTVSNAIQTKRLVHHSSRIGLKNLNDRFQLLVGTPIEVTDDTRRFVVKLPLIAMQ